MMLASSRLSRTMAPGLGVFLMVAALLCCSPVAHAIVGGTKVDPAASGSPWSGVGAVIVGENHYTGALISPFHVLTAAHVVSGKTAAQVSFQVNIGTAPGISIAARVLFIHPRFKGASQGKDGVWHDDLAIIQLAEPAPFLVPVYALYEGAILPKAIIALAGYGQSGDGYNGGNLPGNRHVLRVGYNRIDRLIMHPSGARSDVFLFDFDGPDFRSNAFKPDIPLNASLGSEQEAIFAGGDSGGPVFIMDKGRLKILGVAAFVAGKSEQKGTFGAIGGGMLVPAYLDWILPIISQTLLPESP